MKKIEEDNEIAILVNNINNETKMIIKELFNRYKKVRIITDNIELFKKMEKELFDYSGIPMIVTNNKRKALSKSSLTGLALASSRSFRIRAILIYLPLATCLK